MIENLVGKPVTYTSRETLIEEETLDRAATL